VALGVDGHGGDPVVVAVQQAGSLGRIDDGEIS